MVRAARTLIDWLNPSSNSRSKDAEETEGKPLLESNCKSALPFWSGSRPLLQSPNPLLPDSLGCDSPRSFALLDRDFDSLHAESSAENARFFAPKECSCQDVNLAIFPEFAKAKSVYIAGCLVHHCKSHVKRLLIQSGLTVVTNANFADFVILGWWIDERACKRIIERNPVVVTETRLMALLGEDYRDSCVHLKLVKSQNILQGWSPSANCNKLWATYARPTKIANLAGHQDALERLYIFLNNAINPDAPCTPTKRSMVTRNASAPQESALCLAIYLPGTCARLGVELVCKAVGLLYIYCDATDESRQIAVDANTVIIFTTRTFDAAIFNRCLSHRGKIKICLVEDADERLVRYCAPCSLVEAFTLDEASANCDCVDWGKLVASRGTLDVNLPIWLGSTICCICMTPPPDAAYALLVKWLIKQVVGAQENLAASIDDKVTMQQVAALQSRPHARIDYEAILNHVHFYKGISTTSTEASAPFKSAPGHENSHDAILKEHLQSLNRAAAHYALGNALGSANQGNGGSAEGYDGAGGDGDDDDDTFCMQNCGARKFPKTCPACAAGTRTLNIFDAMASGEKQQRKEHCDLTRARRRFADAHLVPLEQESCTRWSAV